MKTYLKITIKLLIAVVFMASTNPILLTAQVTLDNQLENQVENQKKLQEKNQKVYQKNHSLMINAGFLILLGQLSGQLDLNFAHGELYKVNGRFSAGSIIASEFAGRTDSGYYGTAGFAFLIGKNGNYFDLGIGMKFADEIEYTSLGGNGFTASMSYRHESKSGFVINIGVGYPQLPFIAVGFRF